jgi:ankyrin repeat protein
LLCSTEIKNHSLINNKNNIYINSPLIFACKNGHLDIVKFLLTSPELTTHSSIFEKTYIGEKTVLMVAAESGHLDILKFLLTNPQIKEKANINDKNGVGKSALIYACEAGQTEVVYYLLTSPETKDLVSVKDADMFGNNIFMLTCYEGHINIIKKLLSSDIKNQIDVNQVNASGANSFMQTAFCKNNVKTFKHLFSKYSKEFDVNYKDNNGNTLPIYLCANGQLDFLKYLFTHSKIKNKINIHQVNNKNENMFMMAVKKNQMDIVEFLLFDINIQLDKHTISWLEKNIDEDEKYEKTLSLIKKRNLHEKLNDSLVDKKVNPKFKV